MRRRSAPTAAMPAGPNQTCVSRAAAVRCYAAVWAAALSGSCAATSSDADGVGWHDGLLMDLIAEELDQPPADSRTRPARHLWVRAPIRAQ